MKTNLNISIEQDKENFFIASCSNFKGCHSYGKTIKEALQNLEEIIAICLEEK